MIIDSMVTVWLMSREMKDLGVILSSDLSWNKHIDLMVSKANQTMVMVKRACGYNADPAMTKKLYLTLVRCKVEYSTQTWAVRSKRNLSLIEGVQRRCTRYIQGHLDQQPGYKERLETLELLPLSYRPEILDLKSFSRPFKITLI